MAPRCCAAQLHEILQKLYLFFIFIFFHPCVPLTQNLCSEAETSTCDVRDSNRVHMYVADFQGYNYTTVNVFPARFWNL